MLIWFLVGFLILIVILKRFYYGSGTDYQRVMKGETRRGWQLAIPVRHLRANDREWLIVSYHKASYHKSLSTSNIGDWVPLSSVFLVLIDYTSAGSFVISVNQYSLLQPNSTNSLLKIVAGRHYPRVSMCYLSSRIVLVACKKGSSRMRLFLVDIVARTRRNFTIKIPDTSPDVNFTLAYVSSDPKQRLHVVFQKRTYSDAGVRLEFINATYRHGSKARRSLLEPLSSESIEFPVGHRKLTGSSVFGVTLAYDTADLFNTDRHMCFSFDRHEGWRMETMTRWLARFRETQEGASILNAAKAYFDLHPPESLLLLRVFAMFRVRRLFSVPGGTEILAVTTWVTNKDHDGILRRVVKTPSMKRLAAQSIFRARPGLKIFEVEEATGVEISDGVRDDRERKVKIIYL